ncbi:hypothetical protein BDW59DRAFT_169458 [Aspergillus cavernicola]|uniref:Pentatricopeptide repeat protein n=1 Tax=Aspergillus cavernicola TaxID=176166 RepID=A0ABR4IW84_9EURO
MSRPHRLLLSRFRSGLPSCLPQQRLHIELYHQQRKPLKPRYFTEPALQPNITAYNEFIDDLRIPADSHDLNSEDSTSDIPATIDGFDADSSTNVFVRNDSRDSDFAWNLDDPISKVRSPSGRDRNVVHDEVGKIYYRVYLDNGRYQLRARWDIRSNTLSYDEANNRQWKAARNEIAMARLLKDEPQEHPVQLEMGEGDEALLEKLKGDAQGAFREAWGALETSEKSARWPRLSLWLLHHSPSLVPDFLRITCQYRKKPAFVLVRDCILFLTRFFPELVHQSLIMACLHPDAWPVLFLPQRGARLYVNKADRDDVYYAWHLALKKRSHMTAKTYLCFMKRFIEFGDVDIALEALKRCQSLAEPQFLLKSESVMRHCCKLLTLDSVTDDGSARNFRILPKLLKIGVRPTRDMMNVVLANAFKTGDSQVGQVILDYMKEHEMDADSYTYTALLKDAVASGDTTRLQSLLHEIQPKDELYKDPWISSKVLHSHFIYTAKRIGLDEDRQKVFYSMLAMYNQLHDITPLKELSIIPHQYTPPPGSGTSPPSVVTLYIMIATYIRCQRNFDITQRVYSRFRSLVLGGHKIIAPLAATDHTYNEFLLAFRRDPRGLRPSVLLVEDMLRAVSGERNFMKKKLKCGIKHASPSVRTWTLLLSAYVWHKQPHAADRVRAMMGKEGVKFSLVTWNILINGYANSQKVSDLAQTIKQMESEGFTIDDYTVKSLRYLRNPEQLWVSIDELDKESEEAFDQSSVLSDQEQEKEALSLVDQGLQRWKDQLKLKG